MSYHSKGGERYWLCVRCWDIPYQHVLDRRDGNCTTHGEVTEVKLEAIPPRRMMAAASESEHEQRGGEPVDMGRMG